MADTGCNGALEKADERLRVITNRFKKYDRGST